MSPSTFPSSDPSSMTSPLGVTGISAMEGGAASSFVASGAATGGAVCVGGARGIGAGSASLAESKDAGETAMIPASSFTPDFAYSFPAPTETINATSRTIKDARNSLKVVCKSCCAF